MFFSRLLSSLLPVIYWPVKIRKRAAVPAGEFSQLANLPIFNPMAATTSGVNDQFYTRLPINELPLSELLMEEHLFFPIPANWHVLVTDVKGSTEAIQNGMHETINLLATGSIVAVLNIAYKSNLSIPFFFGGDGATCIVPPGILNESLEALLIHQQNTQKNFSLFLRVGSMAVSDIYQQGHELRIGKLRASRLFAIPVSLGDGLSYAEKVIKGEDYLLSVKPGTNYDLDLTGMQCRWDKIQPPVEKNEIVSLLVIARDASSQAIVFKKVIDLLDSIYGQANHRKPISVPRLRMNGTLGKIALEMKTRFGGMKPMVFIKSWLTSALAKFYFSTKQGKKYLLQLVEMSDTLVIDGRINTVISGTNEQRQSLQHSLDALEKNGEIIYGLHVSKSSVMSCYVRSINEDHIHFVDGSEGGYTRAAGVIKQKIRENPSWSLSS